MSGAAPRWGRTAGAALRALWRRPLLWPVALTTLLRLARPGWWRRWPPLPLPPEPYWRFRMVTAYGGDGTGRVPEIDDIVAYLEWCRRTPPGRG